MLRNTEFGGYVASGARTSTCIAVKIHTGLTKLEINEQMQKFYQVEEVGGNGTSQSTETIAEHEFVERHFKTTVQQNENNRFIASVLKKFNINCLVVLCREQ